MLKDGTFYQDLGGDYLVKRDAAKTDAKLARRIKDLAISSGCVSAFPASFWVDDVKTGG
jgi:hypothetical protein